MYAGEAVLVNLIIRTAFVFCFKIFLFLVVVKVAAIINY